MKALAVLYAGRLSADALEPVFPDRDPEQNALQAALERARAFPDVQEVVLLVAGRVNAAASATEFFERPPTGEAAAFLRGDLLW